ncbi:hypothetical protein PVAP13_3KG263668 [Panicum virgatum]|uniref:Uncharacterized protein n=1 Tax=Panicum virgatum TaxID=38727 RepID=A0A8T0V088_PANVG|nr:hypothetical protein PVAP13_3KG263668 [Panicum virgatum]
MNAKVGGPQYETKGLIHVSAPDHPEAGRPNFPFERGPDLCREDRTSDCRGPAVWL